jgi:hypothetical protein
LKTGAYPHRKIRLQSSFAFGTSNANFGGRNISIGPFSASAPVQTNFYQADTIAGGFFRSGGPRAFQFAVRLEF